MSESTHSGKLNCSQTVHWRLALIRNNWIVLLPCTICTTSYRRFFVATLCLRIIPIHHGSIDRWAENERSCGMKFYSPAHKRAVVRCTPLLAFHSIHLVRRTKVSTHQWLKWIILVSTHQWRNGLFLFRHTFVSTHQWVIFNQTKVLAIVFEVGHYIYFALSTLCGLGSISRERYPFVTTNGGDSCKVHHTTILVLS